MAEVVEVQNAVQEVGISLIHFTRNRNSAQMPQDGQASRKRREIPLADMGMPDPGACLADLVSDTRDT